jgi:glutathione synthase
VRIGVFVNDVGAEQPIYTTTRLVLAAVARGHEVWYIGAGDFACDPDDALRARAWRAREGVSDGEALLEGAEESERERICVDDLDVLLLRNDPAEDGADRSWAQTAGVVFGDLAAQRGVVVLNDPIGLSRALTKLYFHRFPQEVRPATLVTRDVAEVRAFFEARGGRGVLKPLQGSGGQGVFIVGPDDDVNITQMSEALARDGYLVAQESLPAAVDGDTRLFLVDGDPLQHDGVFAAFRRIPADGEARSNTSAGAETARATVDDRILRIADAVRPRLMRDGMFFVGLDVIGDHLVEVNVFSPGGLGSVEKVTGVDFVPLVLDAVERARERRCQGVRWAD